MLRLPSRSLVPRRPILPSTITPQAAVLRPLTTSSLKDPYPTQSSRQQDQHPNQFIQNRNIHISTGLPAALLQTASSPLPPPPLPTRPQTSAAIFLSSLRSAGIDITPSGAKALSQILSPVPFSSISSHWLKSLEAAIITHLHTSSIKKTQPPNSKKVWREWVVYQVDALVKRFVRMEGWERVWDFEYWMGDDGLMVRGDEGVRRILEVMVRNGWVVPVEEEEEGGVFEGGLQRGREDWMF